jgi:hypothetical protein
MNRRNSNSSHSNEDRNPEDDESNRQQNRQFVRSNAKKSEHRSIPSDTGRKVILADSQPDSMSPADRRHEIAAILAGGVLRLTKVRPAESAAERLDVPAKTVLSVTRG